MSNTAQVYHLIILWDTNKSYIYNLYCASATVNGGLLSCSCLSWDQMEVITRQMETFWLRQMFWPMIVLLGTPNRNVSVIFTRLTELSLPWKGTCHS